MNDDYQVFVQIRNIDHEVVVKDDHFPPFPTKTSTWSGHNQWVRNTTLSSDLPDGRYKVVVGLFKEKSRVSLTPDRIDGVYFFNNDPSLNAYVVGEFAVRQDAPPTPFDTDNKPKTLDLKGFRQTLNVEFNGSLSISGPNGLVAGPNSINYPNSMGKAWYSVMPSTDRSFGEARFAHPNESSSVFEVKDGILTIQARYNSNSIFKKKWESGMICSVDPNGNGFSQMYGYFVMRAKLPKMAGSWPAFWLLSRRHLLMRTDTSSEIDILEQYGHDPNTLHSNFHIRKPNYHSANGNTSYVPDMTEGYHDYGVLWTKDSIVWYFDGIEIRRSPTPNEFKGIRMYLLANLALGGAQNPNNIKLKPKMKIAYIKAFSLPSSP